MLYDLIVIGGGPAGYHGASLAGKHGLQTLLIEQSAIGGVCLNAGCIPSKTWLQSAKILAHARNGAAYGVHVGELSLDQQRVTARKNKVVKILGAGINKQLQQNKVTVVKAKGEIQGRDGTGFKVKTEEEIHTGKNLLIATGSVPIVPPIEGLAAACGEGWVLTNEEIFNLTAIPQTLVVIGGGVIGLELASYFNAAGSKVTVIEMRDQIGGETDSEIAAVLLNNYRKKGVDFRLKAKVTAVRGHKVQFTTATGEEEVPAEIVLLSVGRQPSLSGFGLETLNLQTENGRLRVDYSGQTSIPGVYAAGDVNGRSMLAHTAYREAEVCIARLLGGTEEVNYAAIPSVIYTDPEVASVGETPASATAKGLEFTVVKIPMRFSGRYVAEHEGGDGICKLLIEQHQRRLLGVHLITEYASELIFGAGLMIGREMTVEEIGKVVFPHPTISEILKEAVMQF